MARTPLTAAAYARTVVAVPPIALDESLSVAVEANRAIVRHIEAGGVDILLYGGNANLYNFDHGRYADALAMMDAVAAPETHVITSIGPDFGKISDQIPLVARSNLRNVMLLPMAFPADADGVAAGVRAAADGLGHGVILYIKRETYLAPAALARLVEDGAVVFVKYAVERADPANDAYLDAVVAAAGRERVASGMGETPVPDHIGRRNLATFTSGAVCIAPRAANALLRLYRSGAVDVGAAAIAPFLAFEQLRARLGGIQVLHAAIAAAGIAETGPLLPMLSNVRAEHAAAVQSAVDALVAAERSARA